MKPLTDRPCILDTDTGADDCVAILLAGAFARERVRMLLSTYGNYSLETASRNCASSAAMAGFPEAVMMGSSEPLPVLKDASPTPHTVPRGLVFTEYSPDFPVGKEPVYRPGWLRKVHALLRENAPCDYIAIGPLTNLALLLRRYPDVKDCLNKVIVMGGGLGCGNVNPYAEYNIYCDALAAEEVFASGLDISVAGLNVCTPTALPESELDRFRRMEGSLGRCMEHIVQIENDLSDSFGNPHGIIYDAVALAYWLEPSLFTVRQTGLRVILSGERYGQTVECPERDNVTWLEHAELPGYYALLRSCLERLNGRRG